VRQDNGVCTVRIWGGLRGIERAGTAGREHGEDEELLIAHVRGAPVPLLEVVATARRVARPGQRGLAACWARENRRIGVACRVTRSATRRPTTGDSFAPWPEHADATTTRPARSMTKSSVGVRV
jgi:hypothetical protein